jgi:hypothetical protein
MSLSARRPTKNIKTQLLEDVKDTKIAKKRLNADIEADLYRRIKSRAVMEDQTVSDITRKLWIDYLNKVSN